MPKTYAMAHLDVTNAEKFMADYGSKVEATITAFGGKYGPAGCQRTYLL